MSGDTITSIEDISEPTWLKQGLGYAAVFPEEKVKISVERLRHSRDGLTGEMLVDTLTGGTGSAFWARLTFASTQSRTSYINTCATRLKGRINRDLLEDMIHVVCRKVAISEREGEPFVTVGNLPVTAKDKWLIENFLPANQTSTIFADGGAGKSYIGTAAMLSVATGREFLPGWRPIRRGRGLYLDWETDQETLDERVKCLCAGMGIDPVEIGYRRCVGAFQDHVEDTLRYCQSEGVAFVVIDSVEMAMSGAREVGGDANDHIVRFYSAIRLLNTTVLTIDHVSKDTAAGNGPRKAYGGAYKHNLVRMSWDLTKGLHDGKGSRIVLVNAKRNGGPELRPVGFKVEFGENLTIYRRATVEDNEILTNLNVPDRIAAILKHGPMSVKEIQEKAMADYNSIYSALSRGEGKRFVHLETKQWGLLTVHQNAPQPTRQVIDKEEELPF